MNTYTVTYTRIGAENIFEREYKAESIKEAAKIAAADPKLRGKCSVRIFLGGGQGLKITDALAEELLFEMDANGADEIELKDCAGTKKYTRAQVEKSLFDNSSVKKYWLHDILSGKKEVNI